MFEDDDADDPAARFDARLPGGLRLFAVGSLLFAYWLLDAVLPGEVLIALNRLKTFFHEAGHGLAALATGGEVVELVVRPGGGGWLRHVGGWGPLVAASGYLGSAAAGAGILALNASPRARRASLIGTGAFMIVVGLAFGGDLFTQLLAVGPGLALIWVGRSVWPEVQFHVLTLLGLAIALDSVQALLHLTWVHLGLASFVAPSGLGHALSDAEQLARATGVPAVAWAAGWTLAAVFMVGLALRRLGRAGR